MFLGSVFEDTSLADSLPQPSVRSSECCCSHSLKPKSPNSREATPQGMAVHAYQMKAVSQKLPAGAKPPFLPNRRSQTQAARARSLDLQPVPMDWAI